MTKRQRINHLEVRIGQLEAHLRALCPIPELTRTQVKRKAESRLDKAIAERVEWLRANGEKECMGSGY